MSAPRSASARAGAPPPRPAKIDPAAEPKPPPDGSGDPRALRATLATAVAGALLFLLLLLAVGGGEGALAPVDRDAGRYIASAGVREVAETVTALGSLPAATLAALISAAALATARRPAAALALVVGLAAVVVSVHLIKAGVGRVRPPGAGASVATASFPSGHAGYSTVYTALAAYVASADLVRRRSRARSLLVGGAVVTLAIGLTRLVLGVHYLSDVVAGWALGAVVFALTAAAVLVVGRMRQTDPSTPATATPRHADPP